jgi:hypothetical protein
MFAMTAAPSQNIRLPTVSAIRLTRECNANLRVKMAICSMPTPKRKFITSVFKVKVLGWVGWNRQAGLRHLSFQGNRFWSLSR